MTTWKCGICKEAHDDLPMDIAYSRPEHYFELPEDERDERAWFNNDSNADVCVIDGTVFLIRAILRVPVEGGGEFGHGVWVLVDEPDFAKYANFEGDGSKEPPFQGHLSSEVPGYPSTFMLPVEIQLGSPTQRPSVSLKPSAHPFSTEQREGITMARVHELVQAALPEMFE
jgi:hypothetical protein